MAIYRSATIPTPITSRLHLDFEAKSEVDLSDVGSFRYATDTTTQVLMLAYALDDAEPRLWLPGAPLPDDLADPLADPFIEKWAWNAAFERLIFRHALKLEIPANEWRCAQVLGRYHSLPGKLELAGPILGLAEDDLKQAEGKRLIKMFCEPFIKASDRPLFGPSPAVFLDRVTNPADWQLFEHYCLNDIRSERAIVHKLDKSPLPEREWQNYALDQEMNDRGVPIDVGLVRGARSVIAVEKNRLFEELRSITRLENPNSDQQILGFVRAQGYPFSKIGKQFVARALAGEGAITEECRKVLELRVQLAKSSVDKFDSFEKMLVDGRLGHQFVFMGAARTGREASKGINLQNLLRPVKELEDEARLDQAIALLKAGDYQGIHTGFKASVLDVVASCLRPVFRAPEGSRFVIADLSQIESIVVGWLANCQNIIKVYTSPPPYDDAYKYFATLMYGIPYEQVTKAQRNICKPAVLGCNYRLSAGMETENADGDTIKTGLLGYAAAMGVEMTQEEAERAVDVFREKFPEVKQLWYDLERAFVSAVDGKPCTAGRCRFEVIDDVLYVRLPSGRCLHYLRPRVVRSQAESRSGRAYEKKSLYYDGQDASTHQWVQTDTHGGKLLENCSQAIARDVLFEGLRRAAVAGFKVVAHVHDEIIALVSYMSALTVADLEYCMAAPVQWADGLPLKAAGFESESYRKG